MTKHSSEIEVTSTATAYLKKNLQLKEERMKKWKEWENVSRLIIRVYEQYQPIILCAEEADLAFTALQEKNETFIRWKEGGRERFINRQFIISFDFYPAGVPLQDESIA